MGVKINGEHLTHLRFADDIVLITEKHCELEYMLKSLDEESRKCGLHMNTSKTCLMTNREQVPIILQATEIIYVDKYIYLGQNIGFTDLTLEEVNRRIKNTWKKYWSLKEVFKSNIPTRLKKKAMDTIILPTLLYGCQTWAFTQDIINKLQSSQRAMERSMLGFKLKDRKRNKDIRKLTKVIDAVEVACRMKWRWAGHVARTKDGRWSEKVLHWYPRDRIRPVGRPKRRWSDDIVAVAGQTWTRLAQDRTKWTEMEEAYTLKWVSKL